MSSRGEIYETLVLKAGLKFQLTANASIQPWG